MGLFADCKEFIEDFDGEKDITTFRNSCLVQKMLDNGGMAEFGLSEDAHEFVEVISVGPWNDVPKDSPVQRWAVITIRNPEGGKKHFRLLRKKAAVELAGDLF